MVTNEFGLTEDDLRVMRETFGRFPEIKEVILFGSRAKSSHKPGSDVDLAIKGNDVANALLLIDGYLNDESPLPYQFDLLDYAQLNNEDLKEHIDRVGKTLYLAHS